MASYFSGVIVKVSVKLSSLIWFVWVFFFIISLFYHIILYSANEILKIYYSGDNPVKVYHINHLL